ncbi:MAG: T9SS type A sorting domain-containing protein [Bacteroidia bacterium]
MKKMILTLLPFAATAIANAQSISPQVIASAGTHYTGSNAQLSWTIGEPVITTVSNGSNTITQGFHQTLLNVTAVEEQSVAGVNVTVFPNPTSDVLNINLTNNLKDLQMDLFDMTGKLLQAREIGSAEGNVQISMTEYARANYLLRVYSADGSVNFTYKVQKMNAH